MKLHSFSSILTFLSCCTLLVAETESETSPTLTLPKFSGDSQRYGALVFGDEPETKHMWFVIDQSTPGSGKYDVLYIDLNANANLTEEGERFEAPKQNPFPMSDKASRFKIDRFLDPVSDELHKDLSLVLKPEKDGGYRVSIEMMWKDARITKGPFAPRPEHVARLSSTLKEAPVFRPGFDGDLEFEVWNPQLLTSVRETRFQLFIGHQGSGEGTFMCVDDAFLPKGEHLLATLIYQNESDQEKRFQVKLTERC